MGQGEFGVCRDLVPFGSGLCQRVGQQIDRAGGIAGLCEDRATSVAGNRSLKGGNTLFSGLAFAHGPAQGGLHDLKSCFQLTAAIFGAQQFGLHQ